MSSISARIVTINALWLSSAIALSPNPIQKLILKTGYLGKGMREQVVENYFKGVNQKDRDLISSCFADSVTIRDVCNLNKSSDKREANPSILADRCMHFLEAHPDTNVDFYYRPTCARGRGRWVLAHWYETGTWSGESGGIAPQGTLLTVEGQTRFLVSDDLLITDMVVTRTFSDWEKSL
jgi:hypothetical protein